MKFIGFIVRGWGEGEEENKKILINTISYYKLWN